MKLTKNEIEYLAAWAREEWEPTCYQMPAHQLQLAHGVAAASLAVLIKAWTETEQKKDHEIVNAGGSSNPAWPWSSSDELKTRLTDASVCRSHRKVPAA